MRPSAVYESSAFPSRDVEITCRNDHEKMLVEVFNCNERIRSDALDSHLLTEVILVNITYVLNLSG